MRGAGGKASLRIRRNDMIMVVAGRERGKTGRVMRVLPGSGRVIVERLNLVKRHSKPRGPASPGGIVEKEAPLDASNVMLLCERCNAPVRARVKRGAKRERRRLCVRCGETLGSQ